MEEKLKIMLDAATEANSKNSLPLGKLRQWLSDYIARYEEELRRFPALLKEPHFDLLMADYDTSREGLFVVAVFHSDAVSFLAGRGASIKVREFAERDFPENALDVIPDLSRLFHVFSQPFSVSRADFDAWLAN